LTIRDLDEEIEMSVQYFGSRYHPAAKSMIFAAMGLMLAACAPRAATMSANQQAQNVALLKQAETHDLNTANAPGTNPVTQTDLYSQGLRARTDAAELTHGFPVSQSEIARASAIPDEDLTQQQRSILIRQLAEAKALADRGASDHDDNPILTEDFIEQGNRIDRVMEKLQIGQPVADYEIQAALQSPGFP
jgi:hypothetical protein